MPSTASIDDAACRGVTADSHASSCSVSAVTGVELPKDRVAVWTAPDKQTRLSRQPDLTFSWDGEGEDTAEFLQTEILKRELNRTSISRLLPTSGYQRKVRESRL